MTTPSTTTSRNLIVQGSHFLSEIRTHDMGAFRLTEPQMYSSGTYRVELDTETRTATITEREEPS
jgi:hypothetical protein